MISYSTDISVTTEQFIDVLERSTLAERRPVDEPDRISQMLANADLIVTAWRDECLVGIARSVTDYVYCCYLSDLAVDRSVQRAGIGKELICRTQQRLGPRCTLILLAAPAAADYYPHIGFDHHAGAFILPDGRAAGV